jgi:signal transduction histidine kinase/CheY-like chemotaxis protein
VVLGLGIVSTGLLVWTYRIAERQVAGDFPLDLAIQEVRLEVSEAHLWLEEYLTGDPVVELAEIWGRLDQAERLLTAMLEGGSTGQGWLIEAPLEEGPLLEGVQQVQVSLMELRDISEERVARGPTAGVGSELDQHYDQVFYRILEQARELDAALGARIGRSQRHAKLLVRFILGAWILVVGMAVAELWNREQRRRRMEAALRRSEAELDRTRRLEGLGRLAGGIAHDINNYLAVITSTTELASLTGNRDPKLQERLQTILETAFRASKLLRRLLAFSRRQPAVSRSVDLNGLVQGMQPMIERLLGEAVRLEVRFEAALWKVQADPAQLEQVVLNLLINAQEAMPDGGDVTLTTENLTLKADRVVALGLSRGRDFVRLTVEDTGIGIPAAVRDQIFDPFFTTKDSGKSTGLGLTTVYGAVRHSGGAVEVADGTAGGAVFHVYLPRSSEKQADLPGAADAPLDSLEAVQRVRVLLVEDRDEVRAATAELLEQLGHRVTTARDREDALARFEERRGKIDLVIADLLMPGGGGRELVEELRRRDPRQPALFISGYQDELDAGSQQDSAELEGAVLGKPFSARELQQAVARALKNAPRG